MDHHSHHGLAQSPRLKHRSGQIVAVTGALSLAVAMGIGRFAFTPLMPMMAQEEILDIAAGSNLASANYLGYLTGAMLLTGAPRVIPNGVLVRLSLIATAVLTAAMAINWPVGWLFFRFLAGAFSAFAFVGTSAWAFAHLTRLDASHFGGIVFTGPGLGIAFSGIVAWELFAVDLTTASAWLAFAAVSFVATFILWPVLGDRELPPRKDANARGEPAAGRIDRMEMVVFALAYGFAGFGYIVTATFLPAMAHAELPRSIWLDAFWPLFGAAAAVGCVVAVNVAKRFDPRILLFVAYVTQAIGVTIILPLPTLAGFTACSILVGLPFTAINFFALKEVQRLRPHAPARYMGMLTALYGIGQIAGPPVVAVLLSNAASVEAGYNAALVVAAASLALGSLIYLYMYFRWPLGEPVMGSTAPPHRTDHGKPGANL
ncbi:YbfB/YjiJ family MFS transporter [Sinorhizobium mexicanum]|uniref:YbfB/YjiJ family MFS transporter n=1 Tax=Sinorhizobium mexicanum TaxID=375549 RepID=A0A859QGQ2_9HYPH|nr:YbfB/YjiJ family MFS transporter [Sinorhizobium mexicanum]MBP1881859.1 MFS family permease [Sinorhizobium mexicanum]QLL61605.1 YbfB/YjiJ family MFS transporter [Sinorhizobium mexicanum]